MAKIIEVKSHRVIIENNAIGYLGYFIGEEILKVDQEVRLFLLKIENDYMSEYIFFESSDIRNLAKLLLEIKHFGLKSLLDLFNKISYPKLLDLCRENDLENLIITSGLNALICKEIMNLVKAKVFNIKYSKKQMLVINSLHKLGYKISDIYTVLSCTNDAIDVEVILKDALVKLNEIRATK